MLDLSQIIFNPVENAFATQQLAFLATSITFYHIVTQACAEIKILRVFWESFLTRKGKAEIKNLRVFWQGSDLRLKGFRFLDFFCLPFSPFLLFLLQWLPFYWTCLWLKKNSKKASSRWANFSMEQPGVVAGNFALSFFTQLFEHFCAHLRLHSADHSDLGIIGKIFSSCRSWV